MVVGPWPLAVFRWGVLANEVGDWLSGERMTQEGDKAAVEGFVVKGMEGDALLPPRNF